MREPRGSNRTAMAERHRRLVNVERTLHERTARITSLESTMAEGHQRLANIEKILAERDQGLRPLE